MNTISFEDFKKSLEALKSLEAEKVKKAVAMSDALQKLEDESAEYEYKADMEFWQAAGIDTQLIKKREQNDHEQLQKIIPKLKKTILAQANKSGTNNDGLMNTYRDFDQQSSFQVESSLLTGRDLYLEQPLGFDKDIHSDGFDFEGDCMVDVDENGRPTGYVNLSLQIEGDINSGPTTGVAQATLSLHWMLSVDWDGQIYVGSPFSFNGLLLQANTFSNLKGSHLINLGMSIYKNWPSEENELENQNIDFLNVSHYDDWNRILSSPGDDFTIGSGNHLVSNGDIIFITTRMIAKITAKGSRVYTLMDFNMNDFNILFHPLHIRAIDFLVHMPMTS